VRAGLFCSSALPEPICRALVTAPHLASNAFDAAEGEEESQGKKERLD
jgi:hypothetical protein